MEPYWKSVTELLDEYCDGKISKLEAENDSLKIKLANAQERYVKLLKEYKDYKKKVEKLYVAFEKKHEKREKAFKAAYWCLDKFIMNR